MGLFNFKSKSNEHLQEAVKTREYSIMYPGDYTCDLVPELGAYFGIPIDEDILEEAILEEGDSSKNIARFYDPNNKNNLLVVACLNDEGFHFIVLRCDANCSEKYKKKLLEVDTRMRIVGKQKTQSDLTDLTNISEHGLSRLEKDYGISFE